MTAYTRKYDGMWLCSLTPEQHARTCNYWYTVTTFGCTAHTAFTHKAHLLAWLAERGLTFDTPLPEQGQHSVQRIKGAYFDARHTSRASFESVKGDATVKLDNANYTPATLTRDADGIVTVHINGDFDDRDTLDYQSTRAKVG